MYRDCRAVKFSFILRVPAQQRLQEQRVALLRNCLHPRKAAERSGMLLNRCTERQIWAKSRHQLNLG